MTGEVCLRAVEEADLPVFFEQQFDPEATRVAAFPARGWDDFLAHWSRLLADETVEKKSILFDGHLAGNIGCFWHEGSREVGYWLGRAFWGQGIATRALACFLEQVSDRPLHAYVAKHNHASRRVLEKCGFTLVGEEPEFSVIDDQIVEGYIMKLS